MLKTLYAFCNPQILFLPVRAIDSDKSNNIKEKYSLATTGNSANDASTMHHFSVNQDHGWITLVNKLDYEVCLFSLFQLFFIHIIIAI